MTRHRTIAALALTALSALSFAACGGGGSGSSGGTSVVPTPTTSAPATTVTPSASASPAPKASSSPNAAAGASPSASPSPSPSPSASPSPSPSPIAVTGTVTEFTSGMPLSGFTVTIGATPNPTTCLANQTNTSQPCGVPASILATTSTSSTGAFSIPVPAAGSYLLTIALNSTYATLHQFVTVGSTGLAMGSVHVAALSSDEQNWLIDLNNQRATVSFPTSFSNLVIDEFAEEQARAEAAAIASGAQPQSDATGDLFDGYEFVEAGQLDSDQPYSSDGAIAPGPPGNYMEADTGFMSEKTNCPSGNWQTCPFAENTGHYINLSNTRNVWVGLGESSVASGQYAFFSAIFATDGFGTAPASLRRLK